MTMRRDRPTALELAGWKRQGLSDPQIAQWFGVHRRTVEAWRKKHSIAPDGSFVERERIPCQNCGDILNEWGRPDLGLCNACHNYQRRHGQPRPPHIRRMAGGCTGVCRNCGQAEAVAKGRCDTCYRYWLRYGKDRTRRHYQRRETCRICGQPWELTREFVKGRCPACRAYQRRCGRERPQYLWRARYWCDCSRPARWRMVDSVSGPTGDESRRVEFLLCDDCAEYEREMGNQELERLEGGP